MSFLDKTKLYFKNSQAWRDWLRENHNSSDGIWLIIHNNNSPTKSVTYDTAVDDAICFGWIDSHIRKYNDISRIQYFSPRKKGSPWSRINKQKIEKLTENGKMTDIGLAKINKAKEDGSWTIYDDIENLVIPEDLKKAFEESPEGNKHFNKLSESIKKGALWRLKSAKRPETRQKRIKEIVSGQFTG